MTSNETVTDERLAEILAGLEKLPHGPWFCGPAEGNNGTAGLAQVDNGAEMWPVVGEWPEAEHIARCDPDAIRSIITELQSLRSKPVAGVVKPLEWHGPDVNDEIYARSAFCVYTIQKQRKSMGFWLTEVGGNYASVEEAKAAAEADYRQRILSCIDLSPQGEPVAWVRQKTLDRLKDMHSGATDTQLANIQFDAIGCSVPLYLAPQPVAISEAMVERALNEWLNAKSRTPREKVRAALTAALSREA